MIRTGKIFYHKNFENEIRLLTWDEEDHGEGLKIVIITNVFSLEEVEVTHNC